MVYDRVIEELILLVEEHHNKKINMVDWRALLQVEEHHFKDILSVIYKRVLKSLFYLLKSTPSRIFSVVYNRAIE